MIERNEIEAARTELYKIAQRHNHDFQHKAVLAASERLDILIAKGQKGLVKACSNTDNMDRGGE